MLLSSGPNTYIKGTPNQAAIIPRPWPPGYGQTYSAAQWVWSSSNVGQYDFVQLTQTFKIKCPGLPLTLKGNSDDIASFALDGVNFAQITDWSEQLLVEIPTTLTNGIPCGKFQRYLDHLITLDINVTNQGGSGGVIFEITSPECGEARCPCHFYMPGCATCSSETVCTACMTTGRRKMEVQENGNRCPCLNGFYEDATKNCVACPRDKHCQTCELNAVSNQVECTGCFCNRDRVLDPSTKSCVCRSGYVVVSGKSYCTPQNLQS